MSLRGDKCTHHVVHAHVQESMCGRACVRVCMHVYACVINGISILFRIYVNPINTHSY